MKISKRRISLDRKEVTWIREFGSSRFVFSYRQGLLPNGSTSIMVDVTRTAPFFQHVHNFLWIIDK